MQNFTKLLMLDCAVGNLSSGLGFVYRGTILHAYGYRFTFYLLLKFMPTVCGMYTRTVSNTGQVCCGSSVLRKSKRE